MTKKHKNLTTKKQKFIALINKKPINNLELNNIINEDIGEHRIDFMIEDKVNVNRCFRHSRICPWQKIFPLPALWAF